LEFFETAALTQALHFMLGILLVDVRYLVYQRPVNISAGGMFVFVANRTIDPVPAMPRGYLGQSRRNKKYHAPAGRQGCALRTIAPHNRNPLTLV
jgi:hypothetical protein